MWSRAHQWVFSCTRWIQSTLSRPYFMIHLKNILPATPSAKWSLPFRFSEYILYVFHVSPMGNAFPSHPPWFYHPDNKFLLSSNINPLWMVNQANEFSSFFTRTLLIFVYFPPEIKSPAKTLIVLYQNNFQQQNIYHHLFSSFIFRKQDSS
jgi:hypothetical protein